MTNFSAGCSMIGGRSSLLRAPATPFCSAFSTGPRRSIRVCRVVRCQVTNDKDTQGRRWKAFLAAALISAGMGAATPDPIMPKASAEESVVERRRAEANKRKEMLSRARENALAKGGVDAGNPDAAALENPESLEAPPVNAAVARADKAVEEGNQNRSAMSSSMLARLKKASADYEKQAGAGAGKPKDNPNPELPSWLKERMQRSQAEPEEKQAPVSVPEKPSGGFSLPSFPAKVTEEKPEQAPEPALKYDSPAPPPAPSTPQKQPEPSFTPPAKVDSEPAQPLKSVAPPPPPPAPKAQPEPAPVPAPAPAPASKDQGTDFGSFFKGALDSPAKPSKEEAKPKPAPQTIIKAPLLRSNEPQAAPKQAAAAAVQGKPGKRKGPLPLWLAEIIVILGLGGTLYATARWSEELGKLWKIAAAQLEALYNKIDKRQAAGQ